MNGCDCMNEFIDGLIDSWFVGYIHGCWDYTPITIDS
jgi:hypothetical protein